MERENFVAGYKCVYISAEVRCSVNVSARAVWHGYHGDRSYKGLPAYGDQHGTAPRQSSVQARHTKVHRCSLPGQSKVHSGTPPRNSKTQFQSMTSRILFHYQTKAANCFCCFYGDDNPCQEGFKGRGFPKELSWRQNHLALI